MQERKEKLQKNEREEEKKLRNIKRKFVYKQCNNIIPNKTKWYGFKVILTLPFAFHQ